VLRNLLRTIFAVFRILNSLLHLSRGNGLVPLKPVDRVHPYVREIFGGLQVLYRVPGLGRSGPVRSKPELELRPNSGSPAGLRRRLA
jgi:hypothetical protein